ncbi:MAG: 3D domain-containing protein [Butyricicoccus sp.]|jgi:3D (Asp-Asp-Asp) domain-containing protein
MSNRLKRTVQVALTTMVLAVLLAVSASAATVKATANVPVRAKAKTSSTKLTTMKKNTSRRVISVSSNKKWVKVKVNGKTGYVNTSRVKYVTASSKKTASSQNTATPVSDGNKIKLGNFKLTFYGDDTITATGKKPQINHTIAVDPRVIPLGSKVYIEGMGTYYAEDTGGAIKGNILDVFVRTEAEANQLGIRYADVYLYK